MARECSIRCDALLRVPFRNRSSGGPFCGKDEGRKVALPPFASLDGPGSAALAPTMKPPNGRAEFLRLMCKALSVPETRPASRPRSGRRVFCPRSGRPIREPSGCAVWWYGAIGGRHRTRIKNEVHAILHSHPIPKCPHADLFGGAGRAWLRAQPLPADDGQAVERHVRELDRLGEDIEILGREIALDALDDGAVKRLITSPG